MVKKRQNQGKKKKETEEQKKLHPSFSTARPRPPRGSATSASGRSGSTRRSSRRRRTTRSGSRRPSSRSPCYFLCFFFFGRGEEWREVFRFLSSLFSLAPLSRPSATPPFQAEIKLLTSKPRWGSGPRL